MKKKNHFNIACAGHDAVAAAGDGVGGGHIW